MKTFRALSHRIAIVAFAVFAERLSALSITTDLPATYAVHAGIAEFNTLSIGATGSPSLTYQWKKNGVVISPGGTNSVYSFQLRAVTKNDAGTYTVEVSDGATKVTSAACIVTVLNPLTPPGFPTQPSDLTVTAGATATFTAVGRSSEGLPLVYQWYKSGPTPLANEIMLTGATSPTLTLPQVQGNDAGYYRIVVMFDPAALPNPPGVSYSSGLARLTVNSPPPPPPSRLSNLSARALVGTGEHVLIAGLIIEGATPKKLLIRALGPTLSQFGVTDALADPLLQVFSSSGKLVTTNDNWEDAPNATDVATVMRSVGFTPVAGSKDAAVVATLDPGSYTAVVSGVNQTKGVGLVDVFEVAGSLSARLVNLSARTRLERGDGVTIAGLIISGELPKRLLFRAQGPALAKFGITDFLADPRIELHDSNGTIVATNDDWGQAANLTEVTAALSATNGAFATGSKDAAMVVTLPVGVYTAVLKGANETMGVALFEVFEW